MDMLFDPITLVALAVATFAGFKLWQVLGRGDAVSIKPSKSFSPNARDLELKATEIQPRVIWEGFADKDSVLRQQLQTIADKDPSFDTANFMAEATALHESILNLFAQGDTQKLKSVLSESTFKIFADEIENRKKKAEVAIFKFIQLTNSEIKSAGLVESGAHIEVRFSTSVVSAIKDAKGTIVSGDDKVSVRMNERWTFATDLSQKPRQWLLSETHDSD